MPGHPRTGADEPKAAKATLTVAEARHYMVELINRDRATQGLSPVELDGGPPTASGQAHAEDMAAHGFLGHWGTDGSVPEQRLTEAGGADMVLENASCFFDEKSRALESKPLIRAREVERAQAMFFNEVPPNDGHRQNILRPGHKKVGIGIAQPVATDTEIPVPCFSQEFTDAYGTYAAIPKKARIGHVLRVEGKMLSPASVAGVGLARVNAPRPLSVSEVNSDRRRSYPVPKPYQMYWSRGYKTPIALTIDKDRFSIDVPLNDRGQPGLYEVSVWGKLGESQDFVMLGIRTILVER